MEDLAVLRFVPQIGLENGLALKRRKIIFEQLPFTIEVIARRGRVTKSRHIPAGVFPETSFGIAMVGCFQWFLPVDCSAGLATLPLARMKWKHLAVFE